MGPFYSLAPSGDSIDALTPKDITNPLEYQVQLWEGHHPNGTVSLLNLLNG